MELINYKINGLNAVIIKTAKFKTTNLIVNFRNYLNEDTVTKKALIPHILKAATENYPNKKTINRQLERLYGANLGISINKQGLLQIISFRVSIINDEYLTKNQTLLDDAFKFLNEIIFHPQLENNVFKEKVVEEEKRLARDQFDSMYNDKIRYAYDKLIQEMCKNEMYSLKAIGKKEDLDDITPKELYESYQQMLKNDTVDFFVVGDINENRVKDLIEKYLPFDVRDEVNRVVDTETNEDVKLNKLIEIKEVNQAKLNIGLRTYTTGLDKDYYPLLVMNAMFGVYPHSLLFKNVREKASLCYYISSNIDKSKGIMVIYAGINKDDYKKAVDIIFEQLKMVQDNQFADELVENSRKSLINDLLEMVDNPVSLLASHYAHLLYNEAFDVNDMIEKIKAVTKEEIVSVSKKIKEDTIFFLTSEEVNE